MAARDRSRSPKGDNSCEGEFDGYSAFDLFEDTANKTGYTYDDLILLPGQINFGVHEVELESRFSRNIKLKMPIVSSPMDTVTESKMAIALALNGGIGVIHRSMSNEDQAKEVLKVKKFKSGFICDPKCIAPTMTLKEFETMGKTCNFHGFPVTEDGQMGSKLLGLVTKRDTDFKTGNPAVADVMTPVSKLVTAEEGIGLTEAYKIVAKSKKGKLPIISKDGRLVALVSHTDLKKTSEFPLSTKSAKNELSVAAAVGGTSGERDRVKALVAAGVDALVIDQKQGDNVDQIDMIKWIKATYPGVDVVAGNVVTRVQAKHLLDAGADAIRVGHGVGSVSRRQEMSACGRAQASAVFNVSKFAQKYGAPVIADGGVGSPGQIVKALCMGAGAVMCGSLLAGVAESPGEYIFSDGIRLKAFRGTNCIDALKKEAVGRNKRSAQSQLHAASGVSGTVQDKGSMMKYMPYLCQSVKHGMQDIGTKSIEELHKRLYANDLRFELRSAAAQKEGGVHGLHSFERKLFA